MNDNYRRGLYSAWDTAKKEFPTDSARRRQRFAELLRISQGLEPDMSLALIQTLPQVLQEVPS